MYFDDKELFKGCTAWFSQSVSSRSQSLWVKNGGRRTSLLDAEFVFSNDANEDDTLRLFTSEEYLKEELSIIKPSWIENVVEKSDIKALKLSHFILLPYEVQQELEIYSNPDRYSNYISEKQNRKKKSTGKESKITASSSQRNVTAVSAIKDTNNACRSVSRHKGRPKNVESHVEPGCSGARSFSGERANQMVRTRGYDSCEESEADNEDNTTDIDNNSMCLLEDGYTEREIPILSNNRTRSSLRERPASAIKIVATKQTKENHCYSKPENKHVDSDTNSSLIRDSVQANLERPKYAIIQSKAKETAANNCKSNQFSAGYKSKLRSKSEELNIKRTHINGSSIDQPNKLNRKLRGHKNITSKEYDSLETLAIQSVTGGVTDCVSPLAERNHLNDKMEARGTDINDSSKLRTEKDVHKGNKDQGGGPQHLRDDLAPIQTTLQQGQDMFDPDIKKARKILFNKNGNILCDPKETEKSATPCRPVNVFLQKLSAKEIQEAVTPKPSRKPFDLVSKKISQESCFFSKRPKTLSSSSLLSINILKGSSPLSLTQKRQFDPHSKMLCAAGRPYPSFPGISESGFIHLDELNIPGEHLENFIPNINGCIVKRR